MDIKTAIETATQLFGPTASVARSPAGFCCVFKAGERIGVGASWKAALRMASKPLMEEFRAKEKARAEEEQTFMAKRWDEFDQFLALRERYADGEKAEALAAAEKLLAGDAITEIEVEVEPQS